MIARIEKPGTRAALAGLALALLALIAAGTRPLLKGFDEDLYLRAADGFLEHGLNFQYAREPGYPWFLALLKYAGLNPVVHVPLVQNAIFLGALYFFLRTVFHAWTTRSGALLLAACIALIPTFCVVCNGAIYTESLTASLVLIELAMLVRLARSEPRGVRAWLGVLGQLLLLGILAAWLGVIKGSFGFIHDAFCVLGVGWLLVDKEISSRSRGVLAMALVLCACGSHLSSRIYLGYQSKLAGRPMEMYYRAGSILYGRTQYAREFDFGSDSPKYLLAAISSSAYQRVYKDDGSRWNFDAENHLGMTLLGPNAKSDKELFDMALQNLRETPVRQLAFGFFEWAHFVFHHTNKGYAENRTPVLGAAIDSGVMAWALKVFNLALYVGPAAVWWFRRRDKGGVRGMWREWPVEVRCGTILCVLFVCAYLAVHFMATTVVRMVWPIAPLLVIFNWQMMVAWRRAGGERGHGGRGGLGK